MPSLHPQQDSDYRPASPSTTSMWREPHRSSQDRIGPLDHTFCSSSVSSTTSSTIERRGESTMDSSDSDSDSDTDTHPIDAVTDSDSDNIIKSKNATKRKNNMRDSRRTSLSTSSPPKSRLQELLRMHGGFATSRAAVPSPTVPSSPPPSPKSRMQELLALHGGFATSGVVAPAAATVAEATATAATTIIPLQMDMYSYAEADVEADNDDDDDKSDEEVTQRTTDDESDIIVDSDHLYHQRTAIRRWSSPQVYCPVPSLSTTTTSTLVPSKRQIFATTRKQAHRNHNRAPKRYPKTSIHPWSPYNHAGDSDADEHNDSAEDDDEEQVYTTNMGNWKESWSIPSSSSICFPPLRQQLHRRHSSTGIRLSVRPVIGTSDATSRRRDSVYPGNRRDNTSSSNRNSNSGVRFHGLLPLTPLVPVRPFSTSSRRHSWAYTTTIRSGTASTSPTSNTSSSSAFVYNYGSAVSSTSTSPAPSRRNSGAISPRTCILQGFLARHSNGHQMYRRPSIKKCGSVCGAEHDHGDDSSSRSATDRGGDGDDEDEGRGGKDESDHDDEDEEEEDQRFLLLAQSPNSSDFDLRDFVDREMEKKARSRQADSPVFFGGFPLLRMTPMDR